MAMVVAPSNGLNAAFAGAHAAIAEMGRPMAGRARYDNLESYYANVQVYNELFAFFARMAATGTPVQSSRQLRNPAYRVVEFYAGHLWPGTPQDAFKLTTKTAAVEKAVRQVWSWSNFMGRRQTIARRFAMFGNIFVKVAQSADKRRVFFRLIDPRHVSRHLFDDQDRGLLTYCRLDIPVVSIGDDGNETTTYVTEIWDKNANSFRRWEHDKGAEPDVRSLGAPTLSGTLTQLFGINFIPIVHAPFKDTGDGLGTAAFELQIPKIEEANRMASELHAKLFRFNKPTWVAMANAVDKTGRPMPGPKLAGIGGVVEQLRVSGGRKALESARERVAGQSGITTTPVGDEDWISLDGMADLKTLVPPINYADALAIIAAQMEELTEDLPEMSYSRVYALPGDASGKAIRMRLLGAIDKAEEARGNILPALVRLNQIAITLGQNGGLFAGVGTYEAGDLDHDIELLPVLPLDEGEKAELESAKVSVVILKDQAGWDTKTALTEFGYTANEAQKIIDAKGEENAAAIDLAQQAFDKGSAAGGEGFTGGGNGSGTGNTDGNGTTQNGGTGQQNA
jgi:hypothetical protein